MSDDPTETSDGALDGGWTQRGDVLHTTAPVAAQLCRDGSRQAGLTRALRFMTLHPFLPADLAVVSEALRRSGTADVVNAHLYVVAGHIGHDILTSVTDDCTSLRAAAGTHAPQVLVWR